MRVVIGKLFIRTGPYENYSEDNEDETVVGIQWQPIGNPRTYEKGVDIAFRFAGHGDCELDIGWCTKYGYEEWVRWLKPEDSLFFLGKLRVIIKRGWP